MKLISGNMLWTSEQKIPNKYAYLSENTECDILIIGAGITGAIISHYFTGLDNKKIIMVDKNIIGYGSTRASTAVLQYEIDNDLTNLIHMVSEDNAVKAFKLCQKAVYDVQGIIKEINAGCDFEIKDCFYYTNNKSYINYMKKEYELRKKYGFDVEFLDEESAKEKFPFEIKAGIYSNACAAIINPYQFTHELIKKSEEKGMEVYENTEIVEIIPNEGNVLLKTNNDYTIKADKVIIATGYEARKYINKKTGILSRTFTIASEQFDYDIDWYNTCIIRDNNDPYIYIRPTGNNRVIIGGGDEDVGPESSKMSNLTEDEKVTKIKYKYLKDKLVEHFPKLKDINIEYEFNGIFAVTKDDLPYIGEYKNMPNCYFSLSYGANGILYSVIAGQLLLDLYLNKNPEDLKLFSFER